MLVPGDSVSFIPGLLRFTLTTNTGAAFSLGSDNASLMTILAASMTLVVVFWVIGLGRTRVPLSLLECVGIGCLLGGALGNLFDRLTQGRVTDFLELAFITFPIFNLADVCIDIGIILILLVRFRHGKERN